MRGMSIYYAVAGILMYGLNAILRANTEPNVAGATMIMAMWVWLLIDAKLMPSRISIIRKAFPGFAWIDLVVILILCAGMSYVAFIAVDVTNKAIMMQVWGGAAVAMVAWGIYALVRWMTWRRPRNEAKSGGG